ncbi:MAG: hypothetical protein ACK4XJ_01425 [Fimbriimonadaceae bacterium]
MLATLLAAATMAQTATIKVYVVSYFPTVGDQMDRTVTGDVGGSYADLKAKTERLTQEACEALELGSRFRGYKLDGPPALRYEVVGKTEFREAMPVLPKRPGAQVPLTDYGAIMRRINAERRVKEEGVQEIWIWGYHGGVLDLWESNMSSPFGDVSNSDRNQNDLPVFDRTYTVYHYNYGRGLGEMLENHMHQFEHLLNHIDGRDSTPPDKWNELLFWGKFVGSDASHKIVTNPARCGWTHYAPNSERDYDWANPRYVETDIEDWKPDGIGKTQMMNADRWDRDAIKWRIYWMQAIPSLGHELTYQGKKLRNWWSFKSHWDQAKRENWTLVEKES